MSYVFALMDEDGDFLDYAFHDEDQAHSIASNYKNDAVRSGIELNIKIHLINSRNLPNFVEII